MGEISSDQYVAWTALQAGTELGHVPTRDQLITATALAFAENQKNDNGAVNHNSNGTTDEGLWQINSSHKDLAQTVFNIRQSQGLAHGGTPTSLRWPNDLSDPGFNAAMMVALSNFFQDWTPWSTYWQRDASGKLVNPGQGPYLAQIPRATAAVDAVLSLPPGAAVPGDVGSPNEVGGSIFKPIDSAISGTLSGINAIGAFFSALMSGALWLRIIEVVAGLALAAWAFASLSGFHPSLPPIVAA